MMFAQQPKGPPTSRPQPTLTSQSEAAAKEKLAGFVYEYLVHNGATKTAESFKGEMLSHNNAPKQVNVGDAPGFLQNWFLLYQANCFTTKPVVLAAVSKTLSFRKIYCRLFHCSIEVLLRMSAYYRDGLLDATVLAPTHPGGW
ncbi:hypothetical protein AB6A40_009968 [Gnathostoma spinigerum]|uniref:LisH domain-containing protein n=1 Tax=Gnathostoma spinigerum TaxID=75299 RepID=A0ABD6EYP0_9BILA